MFCNIEQVSQVCLGLGLGPFFHKSNVCNLKTSMNKKSQRSADFAFHSYKDITLNASAKNYRFNFDPF